MPEDSDLQKIFRDQRIAFFMDFDNMCNLLTPDSLPEIMDFLIKLGRVDHAVIYTDVRNVANKSTDYDRILQAYEFGFKIVHCPKLRCSQDKEKDTVDENLCHDVYEILERRSDINVFVFATHDSNFLRVVNAVKQRGKKIVLIINDPKGSRRLEQIADEVIRLITPETPVAKMPEGLPDLFSKKYENPQAFISAVAEDGFTDNIELKIAVDLIQTIDGMKPGGHAFKFTLDWLRRSCKFPLSRQIFNEGIVSSIMTMFVDCGILEKHKEIDHTYYILDRTNMFVQIALNPGHLENLKALF